MVFDDGRGTVIEHRADQPQPLGSGAEVVHPAGYAAALVGALTDQALARRLERGLPGR